MLGTDISWTELVSAVQDSFGVLLDSAAIKDSLDILRAEFRDTSTAVWNDSVSVIRSEIPVIKADTAGDGTNVVTHSDIIIQEGTNVVLTYDNDTLTIAASGGSDDDSLGGALMPCSLNMGDNNIINIENLVINDTIFIDSDTITGFAEMSEIRDTATVVWNDSASIMRGNIGDSSDVVRADAADTARAIVTDSLDNYATLESPVFTSSLEIPNGNTPTVNAAGEIAWDTDDKTLMAGADGRIVAAEIKSRSFVILDTVKATFDFPFWQTPDSIVITGVSAVCTGGTNVVGALQEYNATGTSVDNAVDGDWTITTSEYTDASFTDPNINAGDWIGWKTTSVSGDVSAFSITFEYYIAK